MGKLQEWLDEDWVRIDSSGNISGSCGASTARKKKREGAKGKQVVANTKAAKVKKMANGGVAGYETKAKRGFRGSSIPGTAVARGCGAVINGRRKRTKGSVSQA